MLQVDDTHFKGVPARLIGEATIARGQEEFLAERAGEEGWFNWNVENWIKSFAAKTFWRSLKVHQLFFAKKSWSNFKNNAYLFPSFQQQHPAMKRTRLPVDYVRFELFAAKNSRKLLTPDWIKRGITALRSVQQECPANSHPFQRKSWTNRKKSSFRRRTKNLTNFHFLPAAATTKTCIGTDTSAQRRRRWEGGVVIYLERGCA